MDVKSAVGGGGWLVALVVGIGAFIGGGAAGDVADIQEHVAEAPASLCPAGWQEVSSKDESHAVVKSCLRDGWQVILTPGNEFSYARQDGRSVFVTDPREVPAWPVP